VLKGAGISMGIRFDTGLFGEKLSDDDLTKIVQDKDDPKSMLGALKELARRKAFGLLELYQRVLGDPAQSVTAKQTVAIQLGSEHLAENQELLLRHLKTKEPSVFFRIVQSLGKIGDEHALNRLEEIEAPDNALSHDSLEFAKSLLAYRLRLNRNLILSPPTSNILKVTKGIPIEFTKAEAGDVKQAFRHVKNELPAVPLVAEGATKLMWPSVVLLLVFTDRFQESKSLKSILDRSALPLVVLKKAGSLGRYFLSEYFFTHPSKNRKEVVLLGTRPRGQLTYAGKIQIPEKGFIFKLKPVDSIYASAIELEGRYAPNERSFIFTKAIYSAKLVGRKTKAWTPPRAAPRLWMNA
jgi:hypothetical protein